MSIEADLELHHAPAHPTPELPEGSDPVSTLSKKGYAALKDGELDQAEDHFAQLLALEPKNNYALVGMGDLLRKRGQFEKAASYYQECLRHYTDNNYALFGLADAYKALGLFHKALDIWQQYLKQDGANITVLTRVADAFRKVRNFTGSKATYQKVLELEPDNAYALIGLGHLFYDFRDYYEALRCWEQMERENPGDTDIRVLTSLGNCHRKLKTYEKGLSYFERVLAQHPDNFYALFGLADCYRGLGRSRESLDSWNKILAFDPHNKVILTRAGDALRALERFAEAQGNYEAALAIEYDQYAVLGLALVQKAQKDYTAALHTLSGMLRNDSGNARLYQEMAECHVALGQKDEAMRLLTQFQKRGIRSPYITDLMARLR